MVVRPAGWQYHPRLNHVVPTIGVPAHFIYRLVVANTCPSRSDALWRSVRGALRFFWWTVPLARWSSNDWLLRSGVLLPNAQSRLQWVCIAKKSCIPVSVSKTSVHRTVWPICRQMGLLCSSILRLMAVVVLVTFEYRYVKKYTADFRI